jgi:isoleucyl-tRNA synthetase
MDVEDDIPWLLSANAAVKRAQEEARIWKELGSSLQCSVVLVLPNQAQPLFEKYIHDLEDIFVVSSVTVNGPLQGDWRYQAEFDVPGGKGVAWVLPPKDHKCPRCWRYVATVEDELCLRCEDVLDSEKEKREAGGMPKNPLSKDPLSMFWT